MAEEMTETKKIDALELSDFEIVRKVLDGDRELFELLMRRHNQRLFRVARSVLNNDADAEDVLQEAYVRAFTRLDQFEGKAQVSTWLSKIVLYEALARLRKKRRLIDVGTSSELEEKMVNPERNPQAEMIRNEAVRIMEEAINVLPGRYRSVLVLREVEGLNIADTADHLGLTEQAVKTRLFRAHALLRKQIGKQLGGNLSSVYSFMNERCDRVVQNVMKRIRQLQ